MDDITKNLIDRMSGGEMHSEISDAVQAGNYNEVKSLLDGGANVNWSDGFGISLLMYAAASGHENIVKLLLENGADKGMTDMNGKTAIDWAREKNQSTIIEIINNFKKVANPKSNSGCFIATAVYGNYDNPNVFIFRNYRDSIVKKSIFGKLFISFYYFTSPPIAFLIGKIPLLKKIFRYILELIKKQLL